MMSKMSNKRGLILSALIFLFITVFSETIFSQPAAKSFSNPVTFGLRDGCAERFMDYYYAMGGGTKGKICTSKNLVTWTEGVQSVTIYNAYFIVNR